MAARVLNHGTGRRSQVLDTLVQGMENMRSELVVIMAGEPRSRCRCGKGAPGPGADVGGVSPVPAQMWVGRAPGQSLRRCGREGRAESRRRCESESLALLGT